VTIRTAPGTFTEYALRRDLKIKPFDERSDLPVYGQWPRVSVQQSGRGFDDVRLYLHDREDIRQPAMRRFLKRAAEAYFEMIEQARSAPGGAEPWKTDGQTWHLSQLGIPSSKRKRWKPALLVELIGRIKQLLPEAQVEWGNKTAVMIQVPGVQGRLMRICTSKAEGLRLELRAPRGALTPAMYDRVGRSPALETRPDFDRILTRVNTIDDIDPSQFAEVLGCCRRGLALAKA
jgi:hypothetical protein